MKIALAGFGQEGRASYEYWDRDGNELVIVSEQDTIDDVPVGVATITGADAFAQLGDFDLIVRSPGINPKKLPYGDTVWSATNEFFSQCPAPIIGVTGTKGKGTTSSFIAGILRAAGKTVHLVGNIGAPALKELSAIGSEDLVVYELSSFQLWDVKKSPHVAVVLAIEPDHLDVHDDMQDYIDAKANIVRFQSESDVTIYNETNEIARDIAGHSAAQCTAYPVDHIVDDFADSLVIPGRHNVENACAAILAVSEYVNDETTIRAGLRSFEGLPHRLKFVAEIGGIAFYDDSIATTPGSAIAAVKAFEQPKVLILGGHDKGGDYTELMEACRATDTKILAIGANGDDIASLCQQYGVVCERETGDMPAIVRRADEIAQSGDVVILSPAAASFDMFKNYADRGDQFIAAVKSL